MKVNELFKWLDDLVEKPVTTFDDRLILKMFKKENHMKAAIWKHKSKFKGQSFFAGYEYNRKGVRVVKFKNVVTGKEVGPKEGYPSLENAKKQKWFKF